MKAKARPWYAVEEMLKEKLDRLKRPMVLLKWVGYEKPDWVFASDVEPAALKELRKGYNN